MIEVNGGTETVHFDPLAIHVTTIPPAVERGWRIAEELPGKLDQQLRGRTLESVLSAREYAFSVIKLLDDLVYSADSLPR